MEDLTAQSSATAIDSTEWNDGMYQEFKNFITIWQVMSQADPNQFNKGLANAVASLSFYSTGGTANAVVLAVIGSKPAPYSYANGLEIRFRPSAANTGNTTVNVAGLGVVEIRREDGTTQLQPGDLTTGRDAVCRYDGTRFLLYQPFLGTNPTSALPTSYRVGMSMARVPADTNRNTQVRVNTGRCRSFSDTYDIMINVVIDKDFSAAFVAGTGGGFPGGASRLSGEGFRFFVIANTVSGEVDAGYDDSATAVNLISAADTAHGTGGVGQWVYRQIGWVMSQIASTTTFQPFRNDPSDLSLFLYAGGGDGTGTEARTMALSYSSAIAIYAPPDSIAFVSVLLDSFASSLSGSIEGWITDTDSNLGTPSSSAGNVSITQLSPSEHVSIDVQVKVNASNQIYARVEQSIYVSDLRLTVQGFRFRDI